MANMVFENETKRASAHLGTHASHRHSQARNALLATLVVLLINLKLQHFDRSAFGALSITYVLQLYGAISLKPLLQGYALYRLMEWLDDNVSKWPLLYVLPAAFFAFFMIEGRFFETTVDIDFFSPEKFFVLVCVAAALGYAIVYYLIFVTADVLLSRLSRQVSDEPREGRKRGRLLTLLENHPFVVSFVALTLVSLPLILISYPGFFAGDCPRQFKQALGIQELYYMHPVLHTLLLRLFLFLGTDVLGSQNLGIYLLCITQSALIISAMAFCVMTLVDILGLHGYAALLVPAVFVLHPRCHQFLMQLTKDDIFCAFLIAFITSSLRILYGRTQKREFLGWLVFSLGTILFRREGIYLILPTILLMALFRDCRLRAASLFVIVCVTYLLWNQVALPLMHVVPGSPRVKYSIMFQQTARYLRDYPDDVTDEEREAIDVILPYDQLADLYKTELSDPVIKSFNDESTAQDLRAYVSAWASMFARHPDAYFRATLNNKYEYFYPSQDYPFHYRYDYSQRYMEIVNNGSGTNFTYPDELHIARFYYQNIREVFVHLPGMGVFYTSFAAVLAAAFLLCYALRRLMWRDLVLLMVLLMQLAVLAAGPTNGSYFRYTFPVVTVLPIFLLLLAKHAARGKSDPLIYASDADDNASLASDIR